VVTVAVFEVTIVRPAPNRMAPPQWDLQWRSHALSHFVMNSECERRWLAAYTRSRHEGRVAEQLTAKEIVSLLPTYERFSRWSDRVRRSQSPLFPGYVFVQVSNQERVPVLQTSGVVNIVSVGGKPAPLAEEEIERVRACGKHEGLVEPHPFLRIGHRVRVKHGPFAGWEGILVEKQNGARLVITVEQIMKSVAINLHGADVEPVN
jgi:transcription antitermination factor NusG